MKRLGIYLPPFDRRPAGLGRYVTEVCGRLIAQAPSVHLYTETPELLPDAWTRRADVHRVPTLRGPGPARLASRHAWLGAVLPIDLRRRAVDVLFSPFHEGMLAPSVPQVLVIHDLTPLVVPSAYFHPLAKLYFRRVLPRALARSTVIAVSENTRRDLVRHLGVDPSRIHVVGEGYDREVFRPRDAREREEILRRHGIQTRFLMYTGTYAAHKNVGLLVDVLRGCRDRGLDLRLVLSGRHDAGEYAAIAERIRAQGLERHVIAPGYLELDELATCMQAATAFVYPSLYEGFGLAPLEAMASGAAVLCSDRASLPEVVGEGAWLLDPERPEPWIEAIATLLRDDARASLLRAAALARAAHHDWDRSVDALWDAIESAAQGRAHALRDAGHAPFAEEA